MDVLPSSDAIDGERVSLGVLLCTAQLRASPSSYSVFQLRTPFLDKNITEDGWTTHTATAESKEIPAMEAI